MVVINTLLPHQEHKNIPKINVLHKLNLSKNYLKLLKSVAVNRISCFILLYFLKDFDIDIGKS